MLLGLYKTAMRLSTPLLESYLEKRAAKGKEDILRAHERRGRPVLPRPASPLVWFHAASVGESLSLLSIIDRVLKDYPKASVMITTGTVTSAKLMADRLPPRAFHQYIPVDHPSWVKGFLDHWKPDLVVWSESEFWPNILSDVKARGIPAILLNARMSEDSFSKWRFAKGVIGCMLSAFDLCLAQDSAEAQRLLQLGAKKAEVSVNLKYAAAPLPYDAAELERLQRDTADKNIILWASTHPSEEEIALRLHSKLVAFYPDLLTIIVPRHPKRGDEIVELCAGFSVSQRSKAQPVAGVDVYIADTLGELGLFYRLARNVVMGGTFADIGGHNPIEPAQTGCLVFMGPSTRNFIAITQDFKDRNAVILVDGEDKLAEKVNDALRNPRNYDAIANAALELTKEKAGVIDDIAKAIAPVMQKVAV